MTVKVIAPENLWLMSPIPCRISIKIDSPMYVMTTPIINTYWWLKQTEASSHFYYLYRNLKETVFIFIIVYICICVYHYYYFYIYFLFFSVCSFLYIYYIDIVRLNVIICGKNISMLHIHLFGCLKKIIAYKSVLWHWSRKEYSIFNFTMIMTLIHMIEYDMNNVVGYDKEFV
jgi:hypothetical protein